MIVKAYVRNFFDRYAINTPVKMPNYHFHDAHELYYLEKGHTKYFVGDDIYILEPGDMVFVPGGVFHKTDSENNCNMERTLLSFDDDFAGDEYEKYIDELKKDRFIKIPQKHLLSIKDILQKIEVESLHRGRDFDQMQKLYLRELLVLISRYGVKTDSGNLGEAYTIMQDAAKFITGNCRLELSLEFLSKKYSMSPSHFSKQFKHITGVGLSEYINVSRISLAEKLLVKTNKTITEIAGECGFNDSNYFASVFKKIKGITPKKYSMIYKTERQ